MIHSQILYIKGTIKVLRNYPQKAIFGYTSPLSNKIKDHTRIGNDTVIMIYARVDRVLDRE